ncbi:hypothetical protein POM88_007146 [Heracleum sosnowskyi]|uniref:RNase H type-1 domain-containing protein n=1 Tax=Heracleum sosnowskyi TaxID=360622 RepID=A0AAD8J4W2_9APIA|nr:hypothetical protein POM88_007146 [Heracleum sosnowskyi]
MKWARVNWRMPKLGHVKVNVHGHFQDIPFPNGNRSGICVVIRDSRGMIKGLFVCFLRIQEQHNNELYALLEGHITPYIQEYDFVNLESDNVGAIWEWDNSSLAAVPEHRYVIQQLNQRKSYQYLSLKTNHIDEDANVMAIYLARHGAANYDQMVIFSEPFGRIFEIWCSDMGLGLMEAPFLGVLEEDINMDAANDVVINEVDDGERGQEAG